MNNEQTFKRIGAVVTEIERNAFVRIAIDPADVEAYEIVRRIERKLARQRAVGPVQ